MEHWKRHDTIDTRDVCLRQLVETGVVDFGHYAIHARLPRSDNNEFTDGNGID